MHHNELLCTAKNNWKPMMLEAWYIQITNDLVCSNVKNNG